MRQLTKINSRVFAKLLNEFKRNFPGYELPDNGHVENRYVASGDDTHISNELKIALLDNSPDYQEFKTNNPKLYKTLANPNRGFAQFEKEFLGLNKPAPKSRLGGSLPRSSNLTSSLFGMGGM